jgi:hypothetical protein
MPKASSAIETAVTCDRFSMLVAFTASPEFGPKNLRLKADEICIIRLLLPLYIGASCSASRFAGQAEKLMRDKAAQSKLTTPEIPPIARACRSRFLPHRKRESRHRVIGCKTARSQPHC